MDLEYDIFEQLPNGSVEWHDVVTGLEAARARLNRLATRSHNEFYAKHLSSNEIVARVNAPKKPVIVEAFCRKDPQNGLGTPG